MRQALLSLGKISGTLITIWLLMPGCSPVEKKSIGNVRQEDAEEECFLYVHGRDSIKMSLIIEDNGEVEGKLAYLFYEKDKSMGTVTGDMHGDTLFVNYSFTAEGTFSTRELAFLKREDRFLMGSGEILNRGNSDVFKDPSEIEFSENIVLEKISCEEMGEAVVL